MSKKVWFIRHGESIANAGAATSNHMTIPLSPLGEEQSERITREFTETPTMIIASRFSRTYLTAMPTLKRFPDTSRDLWRVEEFTYLCPASCINTTAAERKEMVSEYWERCDPDYIDGEGAESFNMLLARARATINRLKLIESGFIVIFAHALFMQAIEALRTSDGKEDEKSLMKRFRDLPRYDNCEILKWENL